MKQVRVLSNAIAEELKASLNERGVVLEGTVFEDKVGAIVASVYEAVGEVDEEVVVEDSQIYMATAEATIGGKKVAEGEYVEFENDTATIYDSEGEIKEDGLKVTEAEKKAFLSNAEELEDDDEDYFEDDEDLEEGCGGSSDDDDDVEEDVSKVKVQNGKKVKLSKNQLKAKRLRASGKLKKGYKLSADGKIVKMTAAEKKARKALGKKLSRKGKAQRKKSLAKAQKIAAGAQSGSVKEGFDITSNGFKISLEEGDELKLENNLISVIREGKVFISGIEVHEGFLQNCIDEGVLTLNDGSSLDEGVSSEPDNDTGELNEAALLTFRSNSGYVLVREGKELPMGNRIRARATLVSEGYQVSSEILDKAANGELVTL